MHHHPYITGDPPTPTPVTLNSPIQMIAGSSNKNRLTTTEWKDEGTICYQVDVDGINVARRQDNDMINGTKLLNVARLSRGKRDGILKNEKSRIVVKVGAMHLKGVWITLDRAKLLAEKHNILETLYPLFTDNPNTFLYQSEKLILSQQERQTYSVDHGHSSSNNFIVLQPKPSSNLDTYETFHHDTNTNPKQKTKTSTIKRHHPYMSPLW